jgi:hypothetical protein
MNRFLVLAAGLSAAALIAGCSGTSLNSNVSRIRAVDEATGTTDQATIYINDGSANGSQSYGQASSYLYVNSGASNFGWAINLSAGGLTTAFPAQLAAGDAYSAILLGNASLTAGYQSPFLDITLDDLSAPPSGDSRVRFIHDAPDAGPIDLYVNGALEQANYPYPGTTVVGLPAGASFTAFPFSTQQFSYVNVPAGTISVEFKEAGTSTVLAGPTSFAIKGGDRYSFFLAEPTIAPTIAYSIQQVSDNI